MGQCRRQRKRPGLRPHLFHAGEDASGPRKNGLAIQVDAGLRREIGLPSESAAFVCGPEEPVSRYFRGILSPLRAAPNYFRVILRDFRAAPK
jgi:hypothetical protein